MSIALHYKLQNSRNFPAALFLHGFLGDCHDFDEIIAGLSGVCCLSVDLPGHGKTKANCTFEETAIALLQLLDTLNIPQATVIGYSMGGRLALYLALQFPDRFPKAVIESASPGLKTEAERLARIQHDDRLADEIETDFLEFLNQWYEQPLFQSFKQHPEFEQKLQARSQHSPIQLARSLRSLSTGRQPSLWEKLPFHKNPMVLMVGERDRKFLDLNTEMQSLCNTAMLLTIPNVGHNIHFEDPETYTRVLRAFLEIDAPSGQFFDKI